MSEPKVTFKINNFRAVENAHIALDGISVLTGENGCGKSSISKLVYYTLESIINFEGNIQDSIPYVYDRIGDTIKKLHGEFPELFNSEIDIEKILTPAELQTIFNNLEQLLKNNINLQENTRLYGILVENLLTDLVHYEKILNEFLNEKNFEIAKSSSTLETIQSIIETLQRLLKKDEKIRDKKPVYVLANQLKIDINENNVHEKINLFEFGTSIINQNENKIFPLHSFENTFYYDTPFSLGGDKTFGRNTHWSNLNNSIQKNNRSNEMLPAFFSAIINNVLKGIVKFDHNKNHIFNRAEFVYDREDGQKFDLLDCATGLRSFAILQLLIKKGLLNNKTLLIIDEPEAHLHPQWVVEYARLIVLLYKNLGVKFLISSHHPDMISAIKYIAEKEAIDEKLNFYLAEKATEYTYNFVNLHTNIEPIFSSFNIAFDRIDQYGTVE